MNPVFQNDFYTGTAKGLYSVGKDSIRLLKLIA